MALVRYQVIGAMPIRDAVTKESVKAPGIVTLDDEEVPRKKGKPLAATIISALIESGCIAAKPYVEPKGKAEKASE